MATGAARKPTPQGKTKTITIDGWRYQLRGGIVMGQVHRDSTEMDVVIDPVIIAEVKRLLKAPAGFDPDAIYLGDNGAAYCGAHLGVTAARTGRDLSGQRIYRVTADDAAFWVRHNAAHNPPFCETCRKVWTR